MSTEHETGGQEHHRDTEKESTGRLRPFPGSRKVYIQGSRPDILVTNAKLPFMTQALPKGWSITKRSACTIRAVR